MIDEVPQDWPSIPEFFAGRSIFITGGTGYIGKGLIEKFLRSCPEIREIFILMRPKKGMSIDERLKKMMQMEVFDNVRRKNPAFGEKLIPIKGEVAEENLGISDADRKLLHERVSIVFHAAANVKFNVDLSLAILSNTRGTRDMYILAEGMKNLVAFVHVSSAYTQTDKLVVEEIYYDPGVDWQKLITLAKTVDKKVLDAIMMKFISPMPNSYTFTKRVAEKVVYDFSKKIPCVLCRPSIVISAHEEPIPGWVEGFSGPIGMMVGMGKGILRATYIQTDIAGDYIPLDATVKSIIIATWKRGMQTITQDSSLHIYNCATGDLCFTKNGEMYQIEKTSRHAYPCSNPIWYPGYTFTKCYYYYFFLFLFIQLLPSVVLDTILSLRGRPKQLLKIQRMMYTIDRAYNYFSSNQWKFINKKYVALQSKLRDVDKKDFNFKYSNVGTAENWRAIVIGARRFLLHEDMADMEKDKKYMKRLYWLRIIKNVVLVTLFVWYLTRFDKFPYRKAIINGLFLIPILQN